MHVVWQLSSEINPQWCLEGPAPHYVRYTGLHSVHITGSQFGHFPHAHRHIDTSPHKLMYSTLAHVGHRHVGWFGCKLTNKPQKWLNFGAAIRCYYYISNPACDDREETLTLTLTQVYLWKATDPYTKPRGDWGDKESGTYTVFSTYNTIYNVCKEGSITLVVTTIPFYAWKHSVWTFLVFWTYLHLTCPVSVRSAMNSAIHFRLISA